MKVRRNKEYIHVVSPGFLVWSPDPADAIDLTREKMEMVRSMASQPEEIEVFDTLKYIRLLHGVETHYVTGVNAKSYTQSILAIDAAPLTEAQIKIFKDFLFKTTKYEILDSPEEELYFIQYKDRDGRLRFIVSVGHNAFSASSDIKAAKRLTADEIKIVAGLLRRPFDTLATLDTPRQKVYIRMRVRWCAETLAYRRAVEGVYSSYESAMSSGTKNGDVLTTRDAALASVGHDATKIRFYVMEDEVLP